MHASEEIARRVEYLARVEDRTPSQIAAAALTFYLALPPEAHAALRYLRALGTEEDVERVSRRMVRMMLDEQFAIAERQVSAAIPSQGLDALASEDDLVAEANALTSRPRSRAPKAGTGASRDEPKRRKMA